MEKSKILIIGATGYFGRHIVKASLESGHPTYILARPQVVHDLGKVQLLIGFRNEGATLLWGSLDDHENLVSILKEVDVVICTIAHHLTQEQYPIIEAIKEAGNIKKFYPSEFGMDVDLGREHIFPASTTFNEKIRLRRTIEAAGIPYTYISPGFVMGWNLASFLQMEGGPTFVPPREKICIYKDGSQKVVYTAERDVATYTIKTVDDPRALNKIVYIRAPKNIVSMNEVVGMWERKIGRTLRKWYMSEQEVLEHTRDSRLPMLAREMWARIYQFHCRGDLVFDMGLGSPEASSLYPEVKYTTADEYLDQFI